MNPVLLLTHNCLELTKKCVESVQRQDIPTVILVFDNGSTDGTQDWLASEPYPYENFYSNIDDFNKGVSQGWNYGLDHFFEGRIEKPNHVLVLNNDTTIPPYFYRKLLSYDVPFVTGIS